MPGSKSTAKAFASGPKMVKHMALKNFSNENSGINSRKISN